MGLTNAERQKRWRLAHNPDRGQQPTFYKMRMTGPRCAEMITEPLQAMRELNPNLNAMLQSTEQMDKVLCESAKLPLKKRRKIASSAVAIHDAHLQRLKAFRSDAGYGYDPMVHAFGQQPPSAPAAPPPDVEEEAEEEDESSLGSRAAMERVMAEIPKTFRGRFTTLGRYLKANPDLIRVTPQGQPIVAGRQLPSAHIIDIMRSLYVWPKTRALPSGVGEVMEALRSAGVPSYLLSNTAARTMYQRLHEAGEQLHIETQTEPELEMEELEHGEKLPQTPEGKHREAEEFATAQRLPFPPEPTVSKVGALAPTKPETKKFSSFLAKAEAPKVSGIPMRHASSKTSSGIRGKQVSSSEASTSQEGHGRKVNVKRMRLPWKPIRILRLPSIPEKPTKRRARKATVNHMGQRRKDVERGRLPGKPIRILRLY